MWGEFCSRMNERKGHSQNGTGPGEFGPDYSDRKRYHLGRSPYPTHVVEAYNAEEKKMACDNIDCSCEGCTCDPCTCTVDNPCGCDEKDAYQGAKRKSRPTGRITNEWKGLI